MNRSMNPLKFGYRILYYIIMFGIFFQFFAYPVYAMVEHFPYGAKSKYYIHYERPDDYLNSEAAKSTEPRGASANNTISKSKQLTKSYRLPAPTAPVGAVETTIEIFSQDKSGTIGYGNNSNSDDPADNIFSFNIEKQILTRKEIRLSYEVYGIENASGISRSINENNATGGYLVKKNSKWNHLEETISVNQLKNGVNHLLFTAFENKSADYKVKNVSIKAVPLADQKLVALADGAVVFTKNNKAYLKGSVLVSGFDLYINNEKVTVKNNEFETIVTHDSDVSELSVTLKEQGNVVYSEQVQLHQAEEAVITSFKKAEGYSLIKELEDKSYGFSLEEVGFHINKESYDKADHITVQKLRPIDLAPLGTNIINVTQNKSGFRFLPEGAKFKDLAQVTVKFDKALLPSGYTSNDVKILYFDLDQRRWLSVPTDTILVDQDKVVGLTDHFTDYIAGIIQSPESPETSSFTPTSISDIKVADPTAGIVQIQPPTANQKGDGTLDFPITVPAGRNGLQPNLSVSYNNNGSSGIAGYGWDISIPFISVDTKFGVPTYNLQKETESYLLNGEELVMQNGTNGLYLPHRQSTTVNRNTTGSRVFFPKVEGSFSKIQRLGNTPSTYSWIVWDKSGTKYEYGNVLYSSTSANGGKWHLTKVTDKNGNFMNFIYEIPSYNQENNLKGGKEARISKIYYTLHQDFDVTANNLNRFYTLTFNYDTASRMDAHFNYRYGFKEVNASKLNYIKVACDKYLDAAQKHNLCNYHVEYHFNYNNNGPFGKTLLNSITTKNLQKENYNNDPQGKTIASEEYTHTFEYYNDIQGGMFDTAKIISASDDAAGEKHSVLSSTKENFSSSEFNFGAGLSPIQNPPAWWPFSFGGTINFAFPSGVSTSSSPTMLLLDIDGDGLDDKVVKIGNQIKYRKNLGGIAFSSQLYNAYNITDLGLYENETQTDPEMSVSIIAGSFSASKSQSNGRSRTYFADVNSDGLIDFVKDRIVYFNRIDPNSDLPSFTDNSALTPNRIFKEGAPDPTVSAPLPDLTVGNDLMDVVKVWVAPKDGDVDISGVISKNFVASNNGIRYSIEHSGRAGVLPFWDPNRPIKVLDPKISIVKWDPNNPITASPVAINAYSNTYLIQPTLLVTATQSTNKNNINVKENDRIYFRVNSSQIPKDLVNVTWDPVVKYVGPNEKPSKYSDAFLYGDVMAEPMTIAKPGQYTITWNALNTNLSEDVTIKVRAYQISSATGTIGNKLAAPGKTQVEIYNQILKANSTLPAVSLAINGASINSNNPDTYIYVEVEASAKFGLEWKTFDTAFIPKLNKTGTPVESKHIVPLYDMRENALTSYPPLKFPIQWPIKIKHNFQLAQCQNFSGDCGQKFVYMKACYENGDPLRTVNGREAKFRYRISAQGVVNEVRQFVGESFDSSPVISDPFSQIQVQANRELYVEYTADEYVVASILSHYQNNNNDLISTTAVGFASGGAVPATGAGAPIGAAPMGGPVLPSGLVRANISTKIAEELGMGTMYKNWGQFAYKGAAPDQNFTPINELYASRTAIMGVKSLTKPNPKDKENMVALMNKRLKDIDYDYEEGTITAAGSPVSLNNGQMEALRHFTMLRPDRAISAWSAHERLYVKAAEMSPYLRYNNQGYNPMVPIPAPTGIGLYGAYSIVKENTSESKSKGRNINFYGLTFGTTDSNSTSRQLNDFMDVNGDGYPDILGDKIQLTTFRGGLSNTILNKNLLGNTLSTGSGDAAGGSTAHIMALADPGGRFSRIRIGGSATFDAGISGGTNKFETFTRPESVLVDINGDGLADLIKSNNAVEFNTASTFVPSTWNGYSEPGSNKTTSRGHSGGFGGNVTGFMEPIVIGETFDAMASSNLDLSLGYSGSRSVTHSEKDFVDFNGDGLPDYINGNQVYFNRGTDHSGGSYSLPRMSESSSSSHGFTVNASILIPISIIPLGIVVKVGGGGGKTWGVNYNEDNISLRDFDGDGYVDIVESSSEKEVKVQFSKIRRTNMLKKVNNPTGSSIELDYATNNVISGEGFGPTYKMPFKKWVLSKVKVNDGFTGDGKNVQQYAFEYQNGLKDRRERKFLGFGEVKSHQLKDDGKTPYRTVEQKYMLNDMPAYEMYLPGDHSDSRKYQYIGNLPTEENTYDGTQRLLSKTKYEYKIYSIGVTGPEYYQSDFTEPVFSYTDTSRIVPLLKRRTNTIRHYNGTGSSPYQDDATSDYFREYNKYGDVTRYVDEVDNNSVQISYHESNSATQYIVNVPISHNVNNGQRLSTTTIDLKGNITAINRYKDGTTTGNVATTNMVYNTLGQLTKVTMPKPELASANTARVFYSYTYDDTFKLFVTEVKDAYGFTSRTTYDHFGMPLIQTDLNGVELAYTYDPMRRMVQLKGPYNQEWTIRNEYRKVANNNLRYAVTKHNIKDEFVTPGEQILHTSSFADGLGRIIQTKKQLAIEDNPNCTTPGSGYRFAISGLQVYDEFGRAVESYLGQEKMSCTGNFKNELESYTPLTHQTQEKNTMVYDMRDRIIQSHVHGLNATTKYAYGYENDGWSLPRAFEKVTLPEGNISITYKDQKGRVTTTKQKGGSQELVTKYRYDILSQLDKVIDAQNKETTYTYDNFGQKTSVVHPDNGLSQFTYFLTGQLKTSSNQKLILQGKQITYAYNFNQLTNITYPAYAENGQNYQAHTVSYNYGANGVPDYAAGRVTKITDLTGTKTMKYGKLGEVLEDTRKLTSQSTGTMLFTTAYRYDSWGRTMEMTYPDGEHLVYGYNSVGQLKSIFADQLSQWYLKDVKYSFFDQPTEITYGNDVMTTNEYDITQRIRAMQLDRPDTTTFMNNVYTYDKNQNISNITNSSSQHGILHMGGTSSKNYTYDQFNRLLSATGTWSGYQENHNYTLNMNYNNTHGITGKAQTHNVVSPAFTGQSKNSYQAAYSYADTAHPHAVSKITYSVIAGTQNAVSNFTYDVNGNMSRYQTNYGGFLDRKMIWDQQNRLLAVVDDNTDVSHYVYDHAGERTFKAVGTVSTVNIGGAQIYSVLDFDQYTLYPSGYMVVDPGKDEYSKHYYINGKRFVSRLASGTGQFTGPSARSADGTSSNENEIAQDTGLDLETMVGAQNTIYSIDTPGNTETDCLAQLDALILRYKNSPPSASTQHCVDHITELRNDPDLSYCESLVEANKYVCTPVDINDPGNVPEDPNDPVLTPGQMEQADCLTDLNVIVAQLAAQIQNGKGSTLFEWYQCIDVCIERTGIIDNRGCWERLLLGDGVWTSQCNTLYAQCGCGPQPVITEIDRCPALAMIYINTYLLPDLSNACAVLNHVKEHYKCVPLPSDPDPQPQIPGQIPDDWQDDGGNNDTPEDDYDEKKRKPIWWYHTDHLGSSTYLTDNFGRPSHYYETLPFGEMMVEHNQSASVPSGVGYDNKYKFNGKELDDATQMYYYGARYYDPRISIFVSVDPLAEQTMTPYQYVTNNPIMFTDPTGMVQDDVYRRDGDKFIWVRKNNENEGTKDHVGVFSMKNGEHVQDTDSDGNLKYEAKDIGEGILRNNTSFTNSPKYYDVNGTNADGSSQPTENDILDFAVKLQSMVKKEISGHAFSNKSTGGEVNMMSIDPYKVKNSKRLRDYENTDTSSHSPLYKAYKGINIFGRNAYPSYHFHTHPDASAPSDPDMKAAGKNPSLDRFIINNRFQKLQYGEYGFFKNKR